MYNASESTNVISLTEPTRAFNLVKSDYEYLVRTAIRKIERIESYARYKKAQIELSWISNEIEAYGFEFFPEHYLREKMDRLEEFVDSIRR